VDHQLAPLEGLAERDRIGDVASVHLRPKTDDRLYVGLLASQHAHAVAVGNQPAYYCFTDKAGPTRHQHSRTLPRHPAT
jgi:hypothetical protein